MSLLPRMLGAARRRIRHVGVLAKARRTSLERLRRARAGSILVLCHGNIYRSPFVERKLATALSPDGWALRSAGFHERVQRPCTREYVELAEKYGVSLADHRSRQVTVRDLQDADIVVIMDRKNWDQLRGLSSAATQKAVWIGCALRDGPVEVQDPYGRSAEETERTVRRLNAAADALARMLKATP